MWVGPERKVHYIFERADDVVAVILLGVTDELAVVGNGQIIQSSILLRQGHGRGRCCLCPGSRLSTPRVITLIINEGDIIAVHYNWEVIVFTTRLNIH